MRRLILKCIVFVVFAAAPACCGEEEVFTDKEHSFAITPPDGWVAFRNSSGVQLGPNSDTTFVFARVEVTEVKEGEPLRSYFRRRQNWLTQCTLLDIRPVKLDTAFGFKLTTTQETGAFYRGDKMQFDIYYVARGGFAYTITASSMKSSFGRYAADFEALVKSFKLLKNKN